MLYKIYCLTDERGDIRYIGYTSLSEARRMAEHRHSHPERRDYKFNLLDVFDNKADALAAEREYISAYRPPENIAPGQGFPESLEAGRSTIARERGKAVRCIDTGEVFSSIAEAARKFSVHRDKVKACCYHQRNSTGGLHFCFVEDFKETLKEDTGSSQADTEVTVETKESTAP